MRGIIVTLFLCLLVSCGEKAITPKPRGFYRIDMPEASYVDFTSEELPYSFSVSRLANVELPLLSVSGDWINLAYESLNAKIYCSYKKIREADLVTLDEESRELVIRSAVKAGMIKEQIYESPEMNVYGTLFVIEGDSPSPIQFILTDSVQHFFRGALYYQCPMNIDSLAPVTEYLHKDIVEFINTFRWK